jgi:hypothetical protein
MTGLRWYAWSIHWGVSRAVILLAKGLTNLGYVLVRAGNWLDLNLVAVLLVVTEEIKPGPHPPPLTDEQLSQLDSLRAQMRLYIQQSQEVWAAVDATHNEIKYYEREYKLR